MSTRKQIVLSAAVVALALVAVIVYAATGGRGGEAGGMQGQNHGAMAGGEGERKPVRLDPESERRIGIAYAKVEYGPLMTTVRVVGVVSYDETRLHNVNPKIEGWVERLYVDFTGASVRKGQPLLAIYSPMLVSTQEELILARELVDEMAAVGGRAAENARGLLESARRRLRYWDIPEDQIAAIEQSRIPQKTLILRAPASGVVLEKNVIEGARIMPGMDLYKIADLSCVWVEGEVFEKDLALVRVGQHARVTFDAYPGQVFDGVVAYIYPTVSAETRTGRIRLELANPDLKFKPGMYANFEFEIPVHRAGIHVPRSAVLATGERSIVFVRSSEGTLVPREVTPGLSSGDHVEILAGLEPGEVVVASASFLIDAESNLGAALGPTSPGPAAGSEGPTPRAAAGRAELRGRAPGSAERPPARAPKDTSGTRGRAHDDQDMPERR